MSLFPICELSSYCPKNWKVKGRVTNKSALRSFTNSRGEGCVFSIDILDGDGGEIRGSFFNTVAQKFYETLDVGKVYNFTGGSVKVANRRYSSVNHNYELSFDETTIIEKLDDSEQEKCGIKQCKYTFVKLTEIRKLTIPCSIDVCGVLRSVGPASKVSRADGAELSRRVAEVVDDSGVCIDVTFWSNHVDTLLSYEGSDEYPIIVIKGISVHEYNESRSLSTTNSTNIIVNPSEMEPFSEIGDWVKTLDIETIRKFPKLSAVSENGSGEAYQVKEMSLHHLKVESENMFSGARQGTYDTICRLTHIPTRPREGSSSPNFYYMACPTCNRKLLDGLTSDDGSASCLSCNKLVSPSPRYLLRLVVTDSTDECYLTCFHDQAAAITGTDIRKIVDNGVPEEIPTRAAEEFQKRYLQEWYRIRVRGRMDEYGGAERPRLSASVVRPVTAAEMGRFYLRLLQSSLRSETSVGA